MSTGDDRPTGGPGRGRETDRDAGGEGKAKAGDGAESRPSPESARERVLGTLPALLVPAAWTFTAAVLFTDAVSGRAVVIALTVMSLMFGVFVRQPTLSGPVLGAWRRVLAVGLPPTLLTLGDLVVTPTNPLAGLALYVWLLAPAYGLRRTAVESSATGQRYTGFAILTAVGGLAVVAWSVGVGPTVLGIAGVALVGIGQTAGILDAVLRF